MPENTEAAVSQIEQRVTASNNTVDDSVRQDIDSMLRSQSIDTTEELKQVSQRLQQENVLPAMVLDEKTQNDFYQRFNNGRDGLDQNKLRDAANNPNESPYNRLLAQTMADRYSEIDTDKKDGLSRDELKAWANRKADAGGNFPPQVEGDPANPNSVTRTNVNGERETVERNGDKFTVRRTHADGSTSTGEATNFKYNAADGSYSYETSGSSVQQNADGSRTVTNKTTGDVTTSKYDGEGKVTSIEHKDKSGRLSETITRGADGSYSVSVNGEAAIPVKDVRFNGDQYQYTDNQGTTYRQDAASDIRYVTNGDKQTTYAFGADGKPTQITHSDVVDGKRVSRDLIKREGDQYFYTDQQGKRQEIEEPTVTTEQFGVKSKDGNYSLTVGNDGSRSETIKDENGERTTSRDAEGNNTVETKSKDGKTTRKVKTDKTGAVQSIEEKNDQTTTTITADGKGGFVKKTHTNDGSKPDVEVPVTDVKADANGNYKYDQALNGRKFTMNSDGTMDYTTKGGDTLWAISKDIIKATTGKEPSGAEIMAMVNSIAGEQSNGITNKDLIQKNKTYRVGRVPQ